MNRDKCQPECSCGQFSKNEDATFSKVEFHLRGACIKYIYTFAIMKISVFSGRSNIGSVKGDTPCELAGYNSQSAICAVT